jgi:hypothetical protein
MCHPADVLEWRLVSLRTRDLLVLMNNRLVALCGIASDSIGYHAVDIIVMAESLVDVGRKKGRPAETWPAEVLTFLRSHAQLVSKRAGELKLYAYQSLLLRASAVFAEMCEPAQGLSSLRSSCALLVLACDAAMQCAISVRYLASTST